eukprot:2370918-Rhodomonas_salina.1
MVLRAVTGAYSTARPRESTTKCINHPASFELCHMKKAHVGSQPCLHTCTQPGRGTPALRHK